jgi:hypothetical protein
MGPDGPWRDLKPGPSFGYAPGLGILWGSFSSNATAAHRKAACQKL